MIISLFVFFFSYLFTYYGINLYLLTFSYNGKEPFFHYWKYKITTILIFCLPNLVKRCFQASNLRRALSAVVTFGETSIATITQFNRYANLRAMRPPRTRAACQRPCEGVPRWGGWQTGTNGSGWASYFVRTGPDEAGAGEVGTGWKHVRVNQINPGEYGTGQRVLTKSLRSFFSRLYSHLPDLKHKIYDKCFMYRVKINVEKYALILINA